MTLNRYSVRRDENEPEIVAALRKAGHTVSYHSQPMDLLVIFSTPGRWPYLYGFLEVKQPGKESKTTPAQVEFIKRSKGAPCAVVTTPEEALAVVAGWQLRGIE